MQNTKEISPLTRHLINGVKRTPFQFSRDTRHLNNTLIITSPLRRCLETALYAFHPEFNSRLKRAILSAEEKGLDTPLQSFAQGKITFLVDPRLCEEGHSEYDYERNTPLTRRRISFRDYFTWPSEFYSDQDEDEDIQQDWYQKKGLWDGFYLKPKMLERGASFKEFLFNRPEKEIIVITSNCFLDSLIKDDIEFSPMDSRTCVWKTTISGRKKLISKSFIGEDSNDEPVQDDDYSFYWKLNPWKSNERSDLFYKWYSKPYNGMLQALRELKGKPSQWRRDLLEHVLEGETEEKLLEEAGPDFVKSR